MSTEQSEIRSLVRRWRENGDRLILLKYAANEVEAAIEEPAVPSPPVADSSTLVEQVKQLQTYAYAWQGTEFGGLVERDKVLAILSASSEPARKDP